MVTRGDSAGLVSTTARGKDCEEANSTRKTGKEHSSGRRDVKREENDRVTA